jgi:uncharacterized protein
MGHPTATHHIVTHPRALASPLSSAAAWIHIQAWLDVPTVWIPVPTEQHAVIRGRLVDRYGVTGNLVTDAHLAALALEHGLAVASADTDFARFTEVRWVNPTA